MPTSGGVRLSGGPAWSETEHSMLESDASSVISIGDRVVLPETSDEDELADIHKYRMPDVGKTRLHLLTKEPLSPSPRRRLRPVTPSSPTRRPSYHDTPTTPTSLLPINGHSSPEKAAGPNSPPRGSWDPNASNVSDSDLVSSDISRAGSIYSLSRVSFTGQLSQLTSMRLPDSGSLARRIASIPSSTEAAQVLSDASEQIRVWIGKASEVLDGLRAEDDVEWAAAGGREGIEEVDKAITRFERLVDVYVLSIEKLQTREDAAVLSTEHLMNSVRQMEAIISSWQNIKQTLNGVKEQVEIAVEWVKLWNNVLGQIAQEMEGLNQLIFEMEEKRHEGAESLLTTKDSIDLDELETIIEDQPEKANDRLSKRFSVPPPFSSRSEIQPSDAPDIEESSLLALFARMQPLRASLDFLPMRLSAFQIRGKAVFPTACKDLDQRRDQLEAQWKKLEADGESLRRELGEDKWVLVFRNAGRQALKMCESITRSYNKLRDGIDGQEYSSNMPLLSKKIENYEAKKTHYGPAIERVLAIIDRGVQDRLTVNGEILRLQSDMKGRWTTLQTDMKEMDLVLEDISSDAKEKQLRDSISTVVSSQRSITSSTADTPGSSPASSIVGTSRTSSYQGSRTPTPLISAKQRQSSFTPGSLGRSTHRVLSESSIPRRTPMSRPSLSDLRGTPSPSPAFTSTPPSASSAWPARPALKADNRPRWSSTFRKDSSLTFAPLSRFEPSPYAKTPVTPKPYIPRTMPSSAPAGREHTTRIVSVPIQPSTAPRPTTSVSPTLRKSSLPVPTTPSVRQARPASVMNRSSVSNLRPPSSLASGRRSVLLVAPPNLSDGNEADSESPPLSTRPPSVMASGRRSSVMPLRSKSRLDDLGSARMENEKPRWR